MSEEETIKSFKSLMYNAKANWDYFSYEILFNFFSLYNNAIEENKKLRKENEELKSKIGNKDKYFELITGLGYDYDGYYNRETSNGNIKGLADWIDELVQAARDGLNDMPYQKWKG